MKQEIKGSVGADAAGRDIVHQAPLSHLKVGGDAAIFNVGGGGTINVIVGPVLSEAAEQAKFLVETRIKCCKDAREYYLRLLNDGKFTKEELRSAIQQGSVQWRFGANEPTIVMPWIEPVFEWMLLGMMGLYGLIAILSIAAHWETDWIPNSAVAVLAACAVLVVLAQKYILQPRRVAIRVKAWMGKENKK